MSITILGYIALYISLLLGCILNSASLGVYLYQLVYFLNPVNRWWGSHLPDLRYSMIVSIAILIAYVINRDKYAHNKLIHFAQLKWLFLMTIVSIIVSFYAVWPEMHNRNLVTQIKLFFFVIIAYKVLDSPQKYERLIWVHILGVFYIGWVAHGFGRTSFERLDGVGPVDGTDANDTAAVLLTALPIVIHLLIHSKFWLRLVLLLIFAYIIDGVVLCNSRGAFVGIFVSMSYFFYNIVFSKNRPSSHKFISLGIIIFSIGLFIYLADDTFFQRMSTLNEASIDGGGKGGSERVFFWIKSLELARQHPFGVGYWGFQYLSPGFIPAEMLTNGMRAIHSTYFQVLSEYGYIGPFLLAGYFLSTFLQYRKIQDHLEKRGDNQNSDLIRAVFSGFIGYIVAAAFIDRLHAEMMYWFPLYIAIGYNVYVINFKPMGTKKV